MLKASGLTLAARFGQAALNFLIVILLSRWLPLAERGEAAFLLTLLAICLAVSEVAAGSTVVVLLGQLGVLRIIRIYAAWAAATCFIITMVGWLAGWLSGYLAIWLAAAAWLLSLLTFLQHIALGKRKWFIFSASLVTTALGPLLVMLLFGGLIGVFSVAHYVHALTVGWLLALVMLGFALRVKGVFAGAPASAIPAGQVWKSMFSRGVVNQLCHLGSLLHNRFLYLFLPAISLGVYANAAALSEAVWMIPGSLGAVLYAQLAGKNQKDYSRQKLFLQLMLVLVLCLGAYLALVWLPSSFFEHVFGAEYSGIGRYVIMLAPGMLAYSQYLLLSYWHSAFDLFNTNLKAIVAGLITALTAVALISAKKQLDPPSLIIAQSLGWLTMVVWLAISWMRKTKPESMANLAADTQS